MCPYRFGGRARVAQEIYMEVRVCDQGRGSKSRHPRARVARYEDIVSMCHSPSRWFERSSARYPMRVTLLWPASDHSLSPQGTLLSRFLASWISWSWALLDNQSIAASHRSLCSATSTAVYQKFTTHNGNRKLEQGGDGDLIERIPAAHITLSSFSRVYSQGRGGAEVLNNSSTIQHGGNGDEHSWADWRMDVPRRWFGTFILRRVDMGAVSGGRRDRTSSGTSVTRRRTALAGSSGSTTMGMCKDMVCRTKDFFSCQLRILSLCFLTFEYHFCLSLPLITPFL